MTILVVAHHCLLSHPVFCSDVWRSSQISPVKTSRSFISSVAVADTGEGLAREHLPPSSSGCNRAAQAERELKLHLAISS